MTEPNNENTGEFISLGDALISAIKQGLIPIPELIQDNQGGKSPPMSLADVFKESPVYWAVAQETGDQAMNGFLLLLADMSDENGVCAAPLAEISGRYGLPIAMIAVWLRRLEKAGLITRLDGITTLMNGASQ